MYVFLFFLLCCENEISELISNEQVLEQKIIKNNKNRKIKILSGVVGFYLIIALVSFFNKSKNVTSFEIKPTSSDQQKQQTEPGVRKLADGTLANQPVITDVVQVDYSNSIITNSFLDFLMISVAAQDPNENVKETDIIFFDSKGLRKKLNDGTDGYGLQLGPLKLQVQQRANGNQEPFSVTSASVINRSSEKVDSVDMKASEKVDSVDMKAYLFCLNYLFNKDGILFLSSINSSSNGILQPLKEVKLLLNSKFDFKKVIIAYNESGAHWFTLILNIKEDANAQKFIDTILSIDSLSGTSEKKDKAQFLIGGFENLVKNELSALYLKIQKDSFSCGYHTMLNAWLWANYDSDKAQKILSFIFKIQNGKQVFDLNQFLKIFNLQDESVTVDTSKEVGAQLLEAMKSVAKILWDKLEIEQMQSSAKLDDPKNLNQALENYAKSLISKTQEARSE